MEISDYAILYLQSLWIVGTSGEKKQIPFMGDLSKATAVDTFVKNLKLVV